MNHPHPPVPSVRGVLGSGGRGAGVGYADIDGIIEQLQVEGRRAVGVPDRVGDEFGHHQEHVIHAPLAGGRP
ncbi:hypothetical protein GCM10020254_79270 [Streptomyces goshikiensis]